MFFDRTKVRKQMEARTGKVLARFGASVRKTAQESIRKRKGTSQPGKPPFSHVGTLKKQIYFAFDSQSRSVVIGPVIFGAGHSGIALPALEKGGRSIRKTDGKRINIQARPFMGPAFEKEMTGLSNLWAERPK